MKDHLSDILKRLNLEFVAGLAAGKCGAQQDGKEVAYVYHSKCGDNGYSRVLLFSTPLTQCRRATNKG